MSVSAAATLSQILPVLLLAFVIDAGLTVNPTLRGRRRVGPALVLTVFILWLAIAEVALVYSVIHEVALHPVWAWFAYNGVILGLGIVVIPHISVIWGQTPEQRRASAAPEDGVDEAPPIAP